MSNPPTKRSEALDRSEEGGHYNEVLKGGFIGGAAGLAIGLGGVFAASKRYPAFRQLTLPFRAFLVTSSTTFAAIVNADAYGQAFARKGFVNADYQDASSRARDLLNEQRTTKEKLMAWGSENRYSIVFASWLASMGVAFAMVNRAPMSTAQKVVQARVYAQGLTLAVLIASAAFEMNDAKKGSGRWDTVREIDPTDPEHKRIIEKRVHKEEYEGQDLWRDMIAAEERRLEAKKEAEAKKSEAKEGAKKEEGKKEEAKKQEA